MIPATTRAQIQGAVRDTAYRPLSYASVLLLNQPDSTVVSGVMATEEGTFSFTDFKPGTYVIGIRMIGYKPGWSKPFTINTANEHIHLDPIYVEWESRQVQDVTVVAKKPVYELKPDRMIVNVENSITSTGSTALEVLEKSPGVFVDRQNETISISGKSGTMVIINGSQSRMPPQAAIQMLSSLSANNIRHIEIITNPPAKYDAEGNAGIINIVMKKNEDFGTNGSFSLGAGVARREKMTASLNINHHSGKINFYGTYNVNYNNMRQQADFWRSYMLDGSTYISDTKNPRFPILLYQDIRMGFDFTISSKTIISLLTSGYIRDWEMDAHTDMLYSKDGLITRMGRSDLSEINKWIHGMGNINIKHHFKEDEILDLNFDYVNYYNDNPSDYIITYSDPSGNVESNEIIDSDKTTPIDFFVGAVDYSRQLNAGLKLEAGLKGTVTQFRNEFTVRYFRDNNWIVDPVMTNTYEMHEDILAAYMSWTVNIRKKTSLTAGLRYEYINNVLDSDTEKKIIDLHYGKLFPTLFLSHDFNDNNTLQFSYGRRIIRPTYNELAPFVYFHSPDIIIKGNEKLVPAFSNNYKIAYNYRNFILSVEYTKTKDEILRFQPTTSPDLTILYAESRNFDNFENYALNLTLPVTLAKWWTMQNNISIYRYRYNTLFDGVQIDIESNRFDFMSVQSFLFNEWLSAEATGRYISKTERGVDIDDPIGQLDLGVQWRLKNGNSRFNLNYFDIFKTEIWKGKTRRPELNLHTRRKLDFEFRRLMLTFTHNFGNAAIKRRERSTGSEEERKRVRP